MKEPPRRSELITVEQAFHALHYFIAKLYEEIPSSDDYGALAGETSILRDGWPADQGDWYMFLDAVDRARHEGTPFLELGQDNR